MRKLVSVVMLLSVMVCMCGSLGAEERGTPADAKKMVDEAIVHIKEVGPSKAFEDFSTPGGKWHNKDI